MAKTQRGDGPVDAISMLVDDHKHVQKLFKAFEEVERSDQEAVRELVETACMELQIHSMLEQEIFYPAVRAQIDAGDEDHQDLLNEAEVEHETVDELVAQLHELEADDAMYCAYFTVLSDYVRHHVRKEEKALFPAVRNLKGIDLQQLAEDMRLRREELFAEIEEGEIEADSELAGGEDESILPEPEIEDETEDAQEQIDISRTRH